MNWDWRRTPGHKEQPMFEFYAEQVAIVITYWIFRRSLARQDKQTMDRMIALTVAAADHEQLT